MKKLFRPFEKPANGRLGAIWTVAECQAFDRYLQIEGALAATTLMENAGAALAQLACETAETTEAQQIVFLVGPGNNGGDALVAARQLNPLPGCELKIRAPLGTRFRPESAAEAAFQATRALGLAVDERPLAPDELGRQTLLVDALFGLGLSRPVAGLARETLECASDRCGATLAVDVPSGLNGDTGEVCGYALRADRTLSFVAAKRGFITENGRKTCGEILLADIGVSAAFAQAWLNRRRRSQG